MNFTFYWKFLENELVKSGELKIQCKWKTLTKIVWMICEEDKVGICKNSFKLNKTKLLSPDFNIFTNLNTQKMWKISANNFNNISWFTSIVKRFRLLCKII